MRKKNKPAGKANAFLCDNKTWGVEINGAILYDEGFTKVQAVRLAELSDAGSTSWEEDKEALIKEGLLTEEVRP